MEILVPGKDGIILTRGPGRYIANIDLSLMTFTRG